MINSTGRKMLFFCLNYSRKSPKSESRPRNAHISEVISTCVLLLSCPLWLSSCVSMKTSRWGLLAAVTEVLVICVSPSKSLLMHSLATDTGRLEAI